DIRSRSFGRRGSRTLLAPFRGWRFLRRVLTQHEEALMSGLKFWRLVPPHVPAGRKANHDSPAGVLSFVHIVNFDVRLAPMRSVFADWPNRFRRVRGAAGVAGGARSTCCIRRNSHHHDPARDHHVRSCEAMFDLAVLTMHDWITAATQDRCVHPGIANWLLFE